MSAVIEHTEILVPGPAQALGALLDVLVPRDSAARDNDMAPMEVFPWSCG